MSEGDFLDDRRRASEDDYFRKKDRELVEKMRAAAAADRAKSELSARTGLSDPALVDEARGARLHAGDGQRAAARPSRPDGVGRGRDHTAERTAHEARSWKGDCRRQPGRSATLGLDRATAIPGRLRARHPVDPRHARRRFDRGRERRAPTTSSNTARASPPPRAVSWLGIGGSPRRSARRSPRSWRHSKLEASERSRSGPRVRRAHARPIDRRLFPALPRHPARTRRRAHRCQHETPTPRLGSIEHAPLPARIGRRGRRRAVSSRSGCPASRRRRQAVRRSDRR